MSQASSSSTGLPRGAPVSLDLPRPRPDGRSLLGQFCVLERCRPATHAGGLHAAFTAQNGDTGWTYLPYGPFAGEAALRAWMEATCAGTDPLFYTVLRAGGGAPLGLLSLMRITPDHGVAEIGHVHFGPALQRTPTSTEAVALLLRHLFDDLGYRRCEWKCDALNTASRSAAQRLGFTYEGTFRKAAVVKGRNRDTAWYSIIDSDWPRIRTTLDAWLGPDNFDSSGAQRRRLADLLGR